MRCATAIGDVLPAATLVIDHFHGPLADIGGAGAFIPSAELRLRHPSGRRPIGHKRRQDAAPASSKPVEDGRVELEVYPETRVRLHA